MISITTRKPTVADDDMTDAEKPGHARKFDSAFPVSALRTAHPCG